MKPHEELHNSYFSCVVIEQEKIRWAGYVALCYKLVMRAEVLSDNIMGRDRLKT
jgi:hypothetical protein